MIMHDKKHDEDIDTLGIIFTWGLTLERYDMTTFNITLTKGDSKKYTVSLGVDILEGKTEEVIREYATGAAVVALQNDSKLALRHAGDGVELESALKTMYPGATVSEYVKPEPKVTVRLTPEAMLAKALGIDVSKVTPELMAQAKALIGLG